MQRVRLTGFGEPPDVFDLETVPGESEPGPGGVLVVMESAAIDPSNLRLARGACGIRPTLPFPMGSGGVGRVSRTEQLWTCCLHDTKPGFLRLRTEAKTWAVPPRPAHGPLG
jgi:D-arabinose 1-dehydrogenase-like Zn-dependent alcohol dehydrogenase